MYVNIVRKEALEQEENFANTLELESIRDFVPSTQNGCS